MHRQGKCTKLNIIEYMHFVYAQPMSTSHGGGGEGGRGLGTRLALSGTIELC